MTVETRGLTKSYPLKTALDRVSVSFAGGHIHALVGENGAGKSTLARLLCGDLLPTDGSILLDGTSVTFASPKDALRAGIVPVHQRPLLATAITAHENIILQVQDSRARKPLFLHAPTAELRSLRDRWAEHLHLNALVKDLGGNMRFYVSLLGALLRKPRVILLDEPSAFLNSTERARLYQNLRTLADSGTNVIVITHSRAEATTCADSVTLLQNGTLIEQFDSPKAYDKWLTQHPVIAPNETPGTIQGGESLPPAPKQSFSASPSPRGAPLTPPSAPQKNAIAVMHLSSLPKNRPALLDASLTSAYGAITAVTGLQEAALDTLEDALTGMETASAKGFVTLTATDGASTTVRASKVTPRLLRAHRTAIVPSDRTFRAAHPDITVEQLLSVYVKTDPRGTALRLIRRANVHITPEQLVAQLSGGMLQRLILTRELATDPALLMLCNPMQGLDIQAQATLCQTLVALARAGKAVLVLGTQDFPLSLCQTVYALESGVLHLRFAATEIPA
ncbi:MAG: ATP-binding cassette domain-containing protein [Treponemataceae bacterium]|nr:ATP-binding cassette domain-containing protein [Treponemataceae bacterium]